MRIKKRSSSKIKKDGKDSSAPNSPRGPPIGTIGNGTSSPTSSQIISSGVGVEGTTSPTGNGTMSPIGSPKNTGFGDNLGGGNVGVGGVNDRPGSMLLLLLLFLFCCVVGLCWCLLFLSRCTYRPSCAIVVKVTHANQKCLPVRLYLQAPCSYRCLSFQLLRFHNSRMTSLTIIQRTIKNKRIATRTSLAISRASVIYKVS